MFVHVIPAGALEILLFCALAAAFLFVVLRVARRNAYLPDPTGLEDVSSLATTLRSNVAIRRIYRSADLVLADGLVDDQRLTFCLTDFASNSANYRSALKTKTPIALYGLATLQAVMNLANSVVLAIPAAKTESDLTLTHSGPLANDYTVRAAVKAHRRDTVDGLDVFVYRLSQHGGPDIEAAVEAESGAAPIDDGCDVIGTIRLFGYLGSV